MPEALFYLDPDSKLNLQAQIRQQLVEAIHLEILKPGSRLPSSRKLAAQLGVARNTVALACQELVAEGLLAGRARSGLYVAERAARPVFGSGWTAERGGITGRWQQWLKSRADPDTARGAPAGAREDPFCCLSGHPDLVHKLIAAGEKVIGFSFEGYWQDLGRADDYEQAMKDFERMRPQFLPEA